jgi:16S rRNA (cytidine1402-2'-O)-methyltransferase
LLHFIPTPIGNLEDISMRSLKLLSTCDVILCEDTRVTKKLINLLTEKFLITTNIKEYISLHSHNEKAFIEKLTPNFFEQNVCYLSDAGMPCISDPGCPLVEYCLKNGIEYEVLPGANALTLAYASSGFCQKEFLFYGFLAHKKERLNQLEEVMFSGYVSILYESPHRLLKLIEQICNIDENREIFLIKEATKMYQQKFKGSSKEIFEKLKNQNIKGEWVVVINSATKISGNITIEDVKNLDIPKKQIAKLMAKLTGKSVKECYNELL